MKLSFSTSMAFPEPVTPTSASAIGSPAESAKRPQVGVPVARIMTGSGLTPVHTPSSAVPGGQGELGEQHLIGDRCIRVCRPGGGVELHAPARELGAKQVGPRLADGGGKGEKVAHIGSGVT